MAMVLLILALLIGAMTVPITAQQEMRRRQDTEQAIVAAAEGLLGFAVANGRLPCPDTDADGAENMLASGVCASQEGDLPFRTLGTYRGDGWDFRLRYRASSSFTTSITLAAVGDMTIIDRGDNIATSGIQETKAEVQIADKIPAVVISVGKNGLGGRRHDNTGTVNIPATGTDEYLNYTGTKKVRRTPTIAASNCDDADEAKPFCEFDDQVGWLSIHAIFNRMVTAGKL